MPATKQNCLEKKYFARSQASLEYLLTYGWALILIATIVGILALIIATPSGYACSGTGDLICKTLGAEGEDLVLSFQNKLPFDIIINPFTGIAFDDRLGYASIIYRGKEYRFEPVTIAKGDTFQITGIGLGNASTITITYTETGTGFEKEWTGNLSTPQKEICNNGISDDGDDLVDCADTDECGECTYNLGEPIGALPEEITINTVRGFRFSNSVNGTWEVTKLKLYVLVVEPPASGTEATIFDNLGGSSPCSTTPNNVNFGWNEITVDCMVETDLPIEVQPSLSPKWGDTFTISGKEGEKPQLLLTLKKG